MRNVTVRQFQRQFYTELKDIPFIVTRQTWIDEGTGQKVRKEIPEFIVVAYTPDSPALGLHKQKEAGTPGAYEKEENTPEKDKPKGLINKLFKR